MKKHWLKVQRICGDFKAPILYEKQTSLTSVGTDLCLHPVIQFSTWWRFYQKLIVQHLLLHFPSSSSLSRGDM